MLRDQAWRHRSAGDALFHLFSRPYLVAKEIADYKYQSTSASSIEDWIDFRNMDHHLRGFSTKCGGLTASNQRQSTICELTFPTAVLAIRLNRKRLAVFLEDQIHLYDISNMKLLHTIETSPNPNGR